MHTDESEDVESTLDPKKLERLATISTAINEKKKHAIQYRKSSGIEDIWAICEDSYVGIDDANRGEFHQSRMMKANALNAPLQSDGTKNSGKKSTIFIRITARYVDAAWAKVCEILLPMDDKAFSFSATPIPSLINGKGDKTPVPDALNGGHLTRPIRPQETAQHPPETTHVPLTTHDLVEEATQLASVKAKKAERRIYDWMVECQHRREMRKVLFDAPRLGTGVLKGPFPVRRKKRATIKNKDNSISFSMKESVVPADKWVSPWNIFPDPACGEDIHNGDHIFERDFFSEKQVRGLIGMKGHHTEQILLAIKDGPKPASGEATRSPEDEQERNKYPYEVWFYTGTMQRKDFEELNPDAAEKEDDALDIVHVIVTEVCDHVVGAVSNPLESGELNYHAVPWVRRPGFWAGVGVSEQIHVPQRITNQASRAWMNNAGISSGPQIVINRKMIQPANKEWEVTPNKFWYMSEDGITDDVRKAFMSFDITPTGDMLAKIVEYGMRLAEESTSIPLISQGLSGTTTPETLGATQLQNNNANQLLRHIAGGVDDSITEPLIGQYYEMLLLDPKVPPDEKGDYDIDAHGSMALVEQSIENQAIGQMTPLAENPNNPFGIDPKKWYAKLCKSHKMDPKEIQYSEEDQAKRDAQQAPPPPAVMVAQIRAKTVEMQVQAEMERGKAEDALAMQIAQLEADTEKAIASVREQTAQLKVKLDTDRDTKFVEAEASRIQVEFQGTMKELELKKELAIMDHANKSQLSVEQVKANLATTAMKLRTEKELAALDAKLQIHTHHHPSGDALLKPAVQTPGKAGQGKALSQM